MLVAHKSATRILTLGDTTDAHEKNLRVGSENNGAQKIWDIDDMLKFERTQQNDIIQDAPRRRTKCIHGKLAQPPPETIDLPASLYSLTKTGHTVINRNTQAQWFSKAVNWACHSARAP